MEEIFELPAYRSGFRNWLIEQLTMRYPTLLTSLRFHDTLYFKGKGLRRAALDVLSTSNRYSSIYVIFLLLDQSSPQLRSIGTCG